MHCLSCNAFLTVLIGHFNAQFKEGCPNNITSSEVLGLDVLTSPFGLSQIIKELAHILENSKSCIYLIFISQPKYGIYL